MMHMKLHRLYPPLLRVLNLGRSLLFIDLISQGNWMDCCCVV
ncbi:hypothetical protein HanRHA438_Chr12g0546801 [Helianthus annuus]|nr:hypothetical protein HanRHA438_Chr12g0546801 [Helianthus annuus]